MDKSQRFSRRFGAKVLSSRFGGGVHDVQLKRLEESPQVNGHLKGHALPRMDSVSIEHREPVLAAAFLRLLAARGGCSVKEIEDAVVEVRRARWHEIYALAARGGSK